MQLDHIYQGDNVTVLKEHFPDNSVDLTVTSPPYDVFDENWNVVDGLRKYKGYSWNFPELAKQLYRVTKPGGVVVWVVGDVTDKGTESTTCNDQANYFQKQCGFLKHDTMIYAKKGVASLGGYETRYYQSFEYMFIFSKGKPKIFDPIIDHKNERTGQMYRSHRRAGRRGDEVVVYETQKRKVPPFSMRGNIWEYLPPQSCGGRAATKGHEHPARFPDQLAEDHIKSWSNEGDIVLDCFAGSGTTLKAASYLRRKWVGIELSPEYIEIAKKRVAIMSEQERLTNLLTLDSTS